MKEFLHQGKKYLAQGHEGFEVSGVRGSLKGRIAKVPKGDGEQRANKGEEGNETV